MKYNNNEPKGFLKEVVRDHVPEYIRSAPKKGFTPPENFIGELVRKYDYRFFDARSKFFNSMLSDRLITLLLN